MSCIFVLTSVLTSINYLYIYIFYFPFWNMKVEKIAAKKIRVVFKSFRM